MLRLFPLGGFGEMGKNCLALEQRGEILLVDCGVGFERRNPGVDTVIPKFDALSGPFGRPVGIYLTHAHEDHVGALSHLLRAFPIPVFGAGYTCEFLRAKAAEDPVLARADIRCVRVREPFPVSSFSLEPLSVAHSIADATAVAIRTDAGMVVHTGDFKFTPGGGEHTDEARLRELGENGVRLLLSDSTGSDAVGGSGSEDDVAEALYQEIAKATESVFVVLFSSNTHRVRALADIASKTDRKLLLLGRSMKLHAGVGSRTGHLSFGTSLLFPSERARELPRGRRLFLVSGTQGESRAAFSRLVLGQHPDVSLLPGDTLLYASRIIPGNEPWVLPLLGEAFRSGARVASWYSHRALHASGHAGRPEQERMLELVRPEIFVPLHGTRHHLERHAALARDRGHDRVCIVENGERWELSREAFVQKDGVPQGSTLLWDGREVSPDVARQRARLAEGGICVVSLFGGEVHMQTHGVGSGALLEEALREASSKIRAMRAPDVEAVSQTVRRCLHRAMGTRTEVVVLASPASARPVP